MNASGEAELILFVSGAVRLGNAEAEVAVVAAADVAVVVVLG